MAKIGFDIDGVLSDSWHKAVQEDFVMNYNDTKNTKKFWDGWDTRYPKELIHFYLKCPLFYTKYMPDSKVIETVQDLAEEGHEIHYVTHRFPEELSFTTAWWLKYYKFSYPENLVIGFTPKDETVRSIGCDYFVEDKAEIVNSLANITNIICRTRPWNEEKINEGIQLIDEVPELIGII
jgi:uncharacterized HAD superfamily protein